MGIDKAEASLERYNQCLINMTVLKELVKFHLLHLIGFTLFILISFSYNENGDLGVILLGTFLYLPFVLLLIGYNILSIYFMISNLTELKQKWLIYIIPLIPILIWYLIADFSITVRFWKLEKYEFWIFMFAWGIFNFIMCLMINKKAARP